jgi:hypothetical protein
VLAVATALLVMVAPLAVPASAATGADDVDRRIKDSRITESSGLAASLLHPGVLWTHNDSGNPPRIYAIDPNGSTTATLTLSAEPNVDWEAIATVRSRAGGAWIAVGDIGDNNAQHSSIRIALVREPRQLRTGSVTPARVLRLRYPGGPRDAEALLADPRTGQLYVVSKTLFGSELFAVPKRVWPNQPAGSSRLSRLTTMTKVASMSAGLITDGTFLPDGRMLLRGYGKVFVMDRPEAVKNGRIATLADATLPAQDQGESIALADGGRQALIGTEGRREPVLRVPVPAAADGSATATLPPDPTDSAPASDPAAGGEGSNGTQGPGGTAAGGTPAGPAFVGVGNLRTWGLVIGGGFAVAALAFGALMLGNRTRRDHRSRW